MRAPFKNITVAISLESDIRAKVLMARLGVKSYSQLVNKLIDMETEHPHDV